MKKIFYLLLLFVLAACGYYQDESMSLSLDVKNVDLDRLALKQEINGERVFLDSIFKKQWENSKEIEIKDAGNYFLSIDKNSGIPLYFEKGYKLKIVINQRASSFYYEGRGGDENEYLAMNRHHPVQGNFKGYKLKPQAFLEKLDKEMKDFFEIIDNNSSRKEFWKKAKSDQTLIKLTALLKYPVEYKKKFKKEAKLPPTYWDKLHSCDLNNTTLYQGNKQIVDEFLKHYANYLFVMEAQSSGNMQTDDRILKCFELIHSKFTDKKVRDKVMYLYALQVVETYDSEEIKKGMDFYFKHQSED